MKYVIAVGHSAPVRCVVRLETNGAVFVLFALVMNASVHVKKDARTVIALPSGHVLGHYFFM